jgi:hypothetical protein
MRARQESMVIRSTETGYYWIAFFFATQNMLLQPVS